MNSYEVKVIVSVIAQNDEDAINYRKELEEKYHKKEEIICPT